MKIELKQIGYSSICINIPINSDLGDLRVWKKIIEDILLFEYLNKQGCLITIDPDKNSVGTEFDKVEKIKHGKHHYLITYVTQFKASDLLLLVESYDLRLGLLIITYLTRDQLTDINLESLFPATEEQKLQIKQSIMYCSDDGYCLNWLNFNLPIDVAINKIKDIANSCNIEVY